MARNSKPQLKAKFKLSDSLINAALVVASREGWEAVSMAKVAMEADLNLADALCEFSDKNQVLAAFFQRVNLAVLSDVAFTDEGESPRDRLFEIIMRRFDVLTPHKHGLRAVIDGFRREPITGLCNFIRMHHSMRLMLETAGICSTGYPGELAARGLGIIYANSLRVWLDDESPDLAVTMAALDRSLMRAERIMGLLKLEGKTDWNATGAS